VSDFESAMREALGNKFTHYVGKEEQLIARTNAARTKTQEARVYMSEEQKQAVREKLKRLEELRQKQYLNGKYSFQRVLDIVCLVYAVSEEELLSTRRFKHLVLARQQIIRILRDKRGMPWSEIGRRLNRDHSTVLHCYNSMQPALLGTAYDEITNRIEEYQG
jgi:chromosomal replication initiation ATPase DnaA